MTTVELRKLEIQKMLGINPDDYETETLDAIMMVGEIAYNLKEMNTILRRSEMVDCAWRNPEEISEDRKYVAISIKHTEYKWKFGKPCVLWGCRTTKDYEDRCFAGYSVYLDRSERYAIGDFEEHGYLAPIAKPEPVPMTMDLCKKWKKYDTVLVDAEEYRSYCKMSYIATEPNEE